MKLACPALDVPARSSIEPDQSILRIEIDLDHIAVSECAQHSGSTCRLSISPYLFHCFTRSYFSIRGSVLSTQSICRMKWRISRTAFPKSAAAGNWVSSGSAESRWRQVAASCSRPIN